ncbi:Putative Holin-X, holin superfamily III [Nocardioides terrae]|uniref:Putative Holin-X, holin superfamily III n=1 Tax=Nocardioides terrae TaxID=574651 RepID=A0A1I1EV98_9ACTN|nr:phage holin family protein [Nocardioides terrae]SFB90616.1 Putative Holin-X, holin superfamily III [Nocardioides terrae]
MTTPTPDPMGTGEHLAAPPVEDERSLGEIFSDVANDLSMLIKQEMELAKTEMKAEAKKAGKGAGLLGGAGLAGYMVLLFLSLTAVFALDEGMPLWLAALIVTAVWAVIAAVLAVTGRSAIRQSNPQLPKTQQTLKEDAAWARAQKN